MTRPSCRRSKLTLMPCMRSWGARRRSSLLKAAVVFWPIGRCGDLLPDDFRELGVQLRGRVRQPRYHAGGPVQEAAARRRSDLSDRYSHPMASCLVSEGSGGALLLEVDTLKVIDKITGSLPFAPAIVSRGKPGARTTCRGDGLYLRGGASQEGLGPGYHFVAALIERAEGRPCGHEMRFTVMLK
jgi:hypothetical protein